MYPKARAPLTEVVLASANARAKRWQTRYNTALDKISQLEAELKLLKEKHDALSK